MIGTFLALSSSLKWLIIGGSIIGILGTGGCVVNKIYRSGKDAAYQEIKEANLKRVRAQRKRADRARQRAKKRNPLDCKGVECVRKIDRLFR